MKTITQYREDVAALMKKIGDMDAKCIAENRDPTEEELNLKTEMMNKVDATREVIKAAERQEALAGELATSATPLTVVDNAKISPGSDRAGKDTFLSLGENLVAIMRAGIPGGAIDPRLRNIQAAATGLGETIPSDGGFLLQPDYANDILQDVFETGILASKCRRIQISGKANSIKINGIDEKSRVSSRYGGIISYWLDEAGTKVPTKPKFRQIELVLKKMIGLCYSTEELLEDAVALEGIIKEGFRAEFGFRVDDSIINGTGAGMPLGILPSGALVTVSKEGAQAATTLMTENVVKMRSRLFATSRVNSVWLINQDVEPQLHTLHLDVGTGGIPVYMPAGGLSGLPYDTLYGRPVLPIEQCATLGTVGDIILADFTNGYILAEKGGVKTDVSIHVAFLNDESIFRFVIRVDGQPVRSTPLIPYKGAANTQSHFIALESRT